MQNPFAAEAGSPLAVVGYIVAVREEHPANAAEGGDLAGERAGEARRIDEDVPRRTHDQVAARAVARLRGIAAVVDMVFEELWKGVARRADAVLRLRADRGHRAGDQRHARAVRLRFAGRLAVDVARVAALGEGVGRDLPAGAAVDAGRVDEEVAGDVGGQPFRDLRHRLIL